MADRAEQDKNVPDGVEVAPAVVGKEIGAAGVEKTLGQDEEKGREGDTLIDRFGDEDYRPTHGQVKDEREFGVAVDGCYFIENAADDDGPEQSENRPTQSAAHYADADGRVGRGNHHVDTDVVEDAKVAFAAPRHPPMVERAAGKHNQHAAGEESHTESILPSGAVAQLQDEPRHRECEDHAGQVGQRIEHFFFGAFEHKGIMERGRTPKELWLWLEQTAVERLVM